jgi:4-cresol dehydrogenase (hydroxylating)
MSEPDEAAISTALDRIRAIVGAEHVLDQPAELSEYRDPFQPTVWDDYTPAAVVRPESVEQLQEIVRVAGELGVPLWTHSQGRNNGYGGAGTRTKGAITISLRRMNRILEIDSELCYALVEPGVSWIQLYEAIRDGGHPLMLSVPDIGWGSVVGNSLEYGITYLPHGQDFMAPCGMEVVLANGELLRTGMGAQPGNRSWNLYRRSFGPSLDQLFMQSNFGIVTKMGIWLQPQPETILFPRIVAQRERDLVELIDTLRVLMLDGTISGVPTLLSTLGVATTLTKRSDWYDGDGPIPDAVIDRIGAELGVGRWIFRTALWGDDALVDHRFDKLRRAFGAIPGVSVAGDKCSPDEAPSLASAADRVVAGVPSLDLAQMAGWYGGEHGGHMSFSPVVPLQGAPMYELNTVLRRLVEQAGLDYMNIVMATGARSAVNVVGNSFDFDDEQATRNVYESIRTLVTEAGRLGYGEYRAHLSFMDLAADQYSWGDHAYRRFVERIKDAVDPAGILSPGKQGIWPAANRPAA